MKETLTYERAHEVFACVQGVLFNKVGRQGAAKGRPSGSPDGHGYLAVGVDGRRYKSHRVVWLMHFGHFPGGDIDHINGVRSDNRIENLREVCHLQNMRNQKIRKSNTSGVMGVDWQSREKKWRAKIMIKGSTIFLGLFEGKEDAEKARKAAEQKHGFHENHGRAA